MKAKSLIFKGAVCLFFLPLCIASQSPTPENPQNEADLIHFGDLIDVDFEGSFEYDWRGTLRSDGSLEGLDQFTPIKGLCRAESDVAADIVRAYSKILRDPKVTAKIVDRSNRAVARLDGAVKTPTRFRIQRLVKLRELIVASGGFTDDVSGEIVILRRSDLHCAARQTNAETNEKTDQKTRPDNGLQILNISINDLLSGKESADPVILSGDTITVGKAVPIYVIGAVNNPKPIYSRSGMTLTRAISTAGGIAKNAIGQKVTIFRRDGKDMSVMQIDLEKIKNGEINDVDLKPFDIIEVAFKGRATRKYPPVIATGDKGNGNLTEFPLRILD